MATEPVDAPLADDRAVPLGTAAEPDLPRVLNGAHAAVLVIDLDHRQVVFANFAATELTGDRVRLPVDVDAWGDAAGLTDLGRRPVGGRREPRGSGPRAAADGATSPLSLIAAGIPVAGEPVVVRDTSPQGSGEDRLLWVTGFPLSDGPQGRASAALHDAAVRGAVPRDSTLSDRTLREEVLDELAHDPEQDSSAPLESRALVVLLQLSGTRLGDQRRLAMLRDRAVIATEMSFSITDPRRPDNPLVWVNPSFTRLTGYGLEEVVGRNCRLLQGPNTDRAAMRRMGDSLQSHEPITEVLLNYRRDGTAFWNQVSISPVTDGSGNVVNFVGVQNDVTERVLVEQERRAALADAEESRAQLRLLAEATTQMTGALDVDDACARLARIVVPQLADLCAVDLPDHSGQGAARRIAVAARDVADEAVLHELTALRGDVPGLRSDTGRVRDGGPPVLVPELPERGVDRYPDDPASAELFERLRLRSAMVVPVRARGRVLGTLTLLSQHPYGRRYGQRDLHLAVDLAGRAGLTVDNARLYEVEHAAAATLQRSLLPVVPEVAGLQVAARYRVGVDGNQVGGDWYDLLPLPDGAVGIAVGDVVGHDLRAAAAMGQLRGVVRSYAWGGDRPGSVLDRCDELVQGLEMAAMATAVYARLEPPERDGTRLLHYANAGHPTPLLLVPPDGSGRDDSGRGGSGHDGSHHGAGGRLVRLDGHRSPMIGVLPTSGAGRGAAQVRCPPGSVLLLYTDGLTDLAGADADERTALLERTLAATPVGASAETVVEAVLAACLPEQLDDDVALLAVRLDA